MRKSGKRQRRDNPTTDRRPRMLGYEELSSRVVLSANPLAEPLAGTPIVEVLTEVQPQHHGLERDKFAALSSDDAFFVGTMPQVPSVSPFASITGDAWQPAGFKPNGPATDLRLFTNSFDTLTATPQVGAVSYEIETGRHGPRGGSFLADDFGRGPATVYVPVSVSLPSGQSGLAFVGLGDLVNAIIATQTPQPRGNYESHFEGEFGGNATQGILNLGGGPANKPAAPANPLGRIGSPGPDVSYSLSALLNNRGEVSTSNRTDSLSIVGRSDAASLSRITTQTSATENRRDDTPQSVATARVEAAPQPRTRDSDGGLIELRSSRKWGPKLAPQDGDEEGIARERQDWIEDWLDSDAWAEQLELLATPAEPLRPAADPQSLPVTEDRAAATDQVLADTEGGLIELAAPQPATMLPDVVPTAGAALAQGGRRSLDRQEVRMDSGVALYQAFELSTEVPTTDGAKTLPAQPLPKLPQGEERAAAEDAADAQPPHSASLTTLGLLLAVPAVRRRRSESQVRQPLSDHD